MGTFQALYDYFEKCPLIDGHFFNAEFLPEVPGDQGMEFSIEAVPSSEVLEEYIRNHAYCQFLFVIASVNEYGPDVQQNIENSGLYENLADWVRANNEAKIFPELKAGYEAEGVFINTSGYRIGATPAAAKYQIQFQLRYYR